MRLSVQTCVISLCLLVLARLIVSGANLIGSTTQMLTGNVTVEWGLLPLFTCAEPMDLTLSESTCFPQSECHPCLAVDWMRSTCLVTTVQQFESTTEDIVVSRTSTCSIVCCSSDRRNIPRSIQTERNAITRELLGPYECFDDDYIGIFCNVTSDACQMSRPCLNSGKCQLNHSVPLTFACECLVGYSGDYCETDDRLCKNDTCW